MDSDMKGGSVNMVSEEDFRNTKIHWSGLNLFTVSSILISLRINRLLFLTNNKINLNKAGNELYLLITYMRFGKIWK